MIARSLIHVKELNCYQLRLQQLSRSNRKIMPSSSQDEDILSCIIFSCLLSLSLSFCKRFICCCNSNPLLIFLLGQIKLCSYYILNSDFQSVDFHSKGLKYFIHYLNHRSYHVTQYWRPIIPKCNVGFHMISLY